MAVALRELLPGFLVLDCDRLRAALSPDACRDNFTNGKTLACVGCPIGAELSGQATASHQRQNSKIAACRWRQCIRCHRPAARLIVGAYCPSCWNRTLELRRGQNAKGEWPIKIAQRLLETSAIVVARHDAIRALMRSSATKIRALRVESIAADNIFIAGFMTGRDELAGLIERLLPGAQILDYDTRPVQHP